MTDMFVVTPFDVYTKKDFCEKKEQLAKEGRKVMAVVFNCRTFQEFEEKYFGEQIVHDREVLAHWNKKIAAEG
jgi:hypothetical protein